MEFQGVSSSSSSTGRWRYEVFLSFRGEDTRHNFTAHLHKALDQKGINTFIDDEKLRIGEEISPALLSAIEGSRISIVVFSETYASSKWCLDELLKIVECKETKEQIVVPVFYKVDPSDVRHQKKSYEKALSRLEERFKDDIEVQSWKAALTQVANLSGWHLENNRNEAKFIDNIVQNVLRIVNDTFLLVAKHPVGIKSRVQRINSLLCINEMNDRRMVGILGAGGIGKTTIAKAIYNSIAPRFEGSCFLPNVRETSLVKLQNKLLSKILRSIGEVDSVDEGVNVIKKRLCSKRVLLILDDVDHLDQLDKLAGNVDWFGLGSTIIITTRDREVLTDHEVVDDLIYEVEELDINEAFELFRWNAFRDDEATDDLLELMKDAINYVGGLPLALEVLGSYLYRKDISRWKSALNKYKSIPPNDILRRLRISYDGLDENEKVIFLDIACFFIGKHDDDIKKLDGFDYSSVDGIGVLIERSLITLSKKERSLITTSRNGLIEMHNLLRDMGREIVRLESPEDPGKRSRLWLYEEVRQVLEDCTGTIEVQGILLDLPEGDMHLSSEAFNKMKRLRLLMVNGTVHFSPGPIFLSNELRVFDWPNCPLESLPPTFRGEKLVMFRMPRSRLKRILEGVQNFGSMKIMNFCGCKFLKIIPDVSSIPNLTELLLSKCTSLVKIDDSVRVHDKLVLLYIDGCYNLSSFPRILKMRSLEYLYAGGCSSLNYFPEIGIEMVHLKRINFGGTGISSIRLNPEDLVLEGCTNLDKFPEKIGDSVQSMPSNVFMKESEVSSPAEELSWLPPANLRVSNGGWPSIAFPAVRELNFSSTLVALHLSWSGIVTIPTCIKRFVSLKELGLDHCKQLREILAFPPNTYSGVKAEGCMSLELYKNKCWLPELPIAGPVGSGKGVLEASLIRIWMGRSQELLSLLLLKLSLIISE
ncbi:TMV resistance protein N-like isoform X2 [Alnus glutinosa]|uniref:TMV resistance protein N-like isoform X2 n=1 Tax=Alnus glutinosa TaxID=3517 RepID=UPI002D79CAED|nr:TMV resistance protein N-like isoform X2 [Alnus glutinosa]